MIVLLVIFIIVMYFGVDVEMVQNIVIQVIEQNMNGIDYLMYMFLNGDFIGMVIIMLIFEFGIDLDIVQVQVQNKLVLVMFLLL